MRRSSDKAGDVSQHHCVCGGKDADVAEMIDDEAIELFAARLRTPLQIEQYLAYAFEEAYRLGVKPVSAEIADGVLSEQIDDPEPVLMEHGYDVRTLATSSAANRPRSRSSSPGGSNPTAPRN
jgi:hypothetical protein